MTKLEPKEIATIRARRIELGWSRRRAAKEAVVTCNSWNAMERGDPVDEVTINKSVQALGIEWESFKSLTT